MKNTRKNNQYTIDNIKEMSREELEFFCLKLSETMKVLIMNLLELEN